MNPAGGCISFTTLCTPALAAPRSLSGATFAVTCTTRCRYFRSIITGPLERSTVASVSSVTTPPLGVRTNISSRSDTWLRKRSSILTLMKYSLPVF